MTRILIADDHPLFREALRHVVDRACPAASYTEFANHTDMLAATSHDGRFDLMFVDLMMPGGDVFAELRALRERVPLTPIIVISGLEDRATIRAVMSCGVAAYIRKSESRAEMERTIARVIAGQNCFPGASEVVSPSTTARTLTPRQAAVLGELAQGRSNRQIATALGIEEITVKVHISAILRKLGVATRLEAAILSRGARETAHDTSTKNLLR